MDVWVVIDFLSSQTTYDYLSVIVGGITGALFACDRNLDIVGAVTLGLMTGYGGGVVRDILLDGHGFYFMQHADLVLIAAAICAFVFFFQGVFKHLDATVFFADALSVGLFALAGASKAVSCDVGFVYAVLLGAITGVGGGAIRDVCVGEVPGVFKESNFYAVASLGGALMYVVAVYVEIAKPGGLAVVRVHGRGAALLERLLRLAHEHADRSHAGALAHGEGHLPARFQQARQPSLPRHLPHEAHGPRRRGRCGDRRPRVRQGGGRRHGGRRRGGRQRCARRGRGGSRRVHARQARMTPRG